VIFIATSNKKEAERLAGGLVKNKFAACVNLMDNITSVFWWEGKIDRASEVLLMVKSKKTKIPKIIKLVKSLHSYEVPEIVVLPIIAGEKKYLNWIDESLR
jgi:periplasmic divalent cation tolerance protein